MVPKIFSIIKIKNVEKSVALVGVCTLSLCFVVYTCILFLVDHTSAALHIKSTRLYVYNINHGTKSTVTDVKIGSLTMIFTTSQENRII